MCIFCESNPLEQFWLTDAEMLEVEQCGTLPNRVPCIIVTGFLGSGKTTFVNQILQGAHGKRFCVVQNEFGATSIDDTLLVTEFAERLTALLEPNLISLVGMAGKHLDGVIIELSGLSEVAPVVTTFFANSFVQRSFEIDAVVTMVDSSAALSQLTAASSQAQEDGVAAAASAVDYQHSTSSISDSDDSDSDGWCPDSEDEEGPPTAVALEKLLCEQISLADIVLLNKVDIVNDEDHMTELAHTLQRLNPTAACLRCDHGMVSLDGVLKVKAFSVARALETCRVAIPDEHVDAPDGTETRHLHQLFGALALEREEALDEFTFTEWLESVLSRFGEQLYRVKGLVYFSRVDGRSLVQCVNRHAEIDRVDESLYGVTCVESASKLVFIGQVEEITWLLRSEFEGIKS